MRSNEEVAKHINEIIDRQIQPSVEMHGGVVTLEKYEDGIATMFMSGACSGCASRNSLYLSPLYTSSIVWSSKCPNVADASLPNTIQHATTAP